MQQTDAKALSKAELVKNFANATQVAMFKSSVIAMLGGEMAQDIVDGRISIDAAYAICEPVMPRTRVERLIALYDRASISEQQTFLRLCCPDTEFQPAAA